MRNFGKFMAVTAAVGTASTALATTNNPLAGIFGAGIGAVILFGVFVYVIFRFFVGGR